MKPINRISALFLMIDFMSACGPQEAKHPPDEMTVQLKWIHQAQFTGCYVAEKKGLYAGENIDITFNAGGPKMTPAIKVAGHGRL